MSDELERLVETLLWEGYALYPYTPGAIKNSTPTPFGIVYPPVYAADSGATHDIARLECVAEAGPDAAISASVRFLEGSGESHQAQARRIDLDAPGEAVPFAFGGELEGRVRLRVEPATEDGRLCVAVCVHNTTDVAAGLSRSEALRHSLMSCHVIASIAGGRFVSPLQTDADSVNTYPVLVGDADEHVLGAAIVLPDHPQLAPESKTSMFDGTEIEEALMLHVLALSDDEREQIAQADPAVQAMLERVAATASAEELQRLHGRVELRDPQPPTFSEAGRAAAPPDEPGEASALIAGVTVRKGSKVRLRPGRSMTGQDVLLDGKAATIERIYRAYDDQVHLGVTVDDDPGQDIMRDIGRFLFFSPTEVEVIAP